MSYVCYIKVFVHDGQLHLLWNVCFQGSAWYLMCSPHHSLNHQHLRPLLSSLPEWPWENSHEVTCEGIMVSPMPGAGQLLTASRCEKQTQFSYILRGRKQYASLPIHF